MNKIISLLFVAILILHSGCKKNFDDMLTSSLIKKNYVPVQVEDIKTSSDHIPIYGIGRVASDIETKLSFKTGGYISSLTLREGDYVKKGRLIGALRTAEIDARVLKAQRALDKTKRDLKRISEMYADSVATLENVHDLTTLAEVSQADLDIAIYNQEFSKIVSPLNGRVLRRLAEPNELVSPGQPIYVIASSKGQSYIMSIFISDKDIGLISYGTRAEILFDAFPKEIFQASVNRIAESADPMTGTFEIELRIVPGSKRMRNGLIGRVTLIPVQKDEFIKIPMISVSEGEGDKVTVFVPTNSDTIASIKILQVVRIADDFVWVNRSEFSASRIITSGSAYLKDGQLIRIQNP